MADDGLVELGEGGLDAVGEVPHVGEEFVADHEAEVDRVAIAHHRDVQPGALHDRAHGVGGLELGAGRLDRVQQTLRSSLLFMTLVVGAAWLLLALGQALIIRAFSAEGLTAELIALFCSLLAASFFFVGALFVANAAFNNLGRPLYSTAFNWARATLGTIPFAYLGAHFGPTGVLIGPAVGAVIFGSLALWVAFRLTAKLANAREAY